MDVRNTENDTGRFFQAAAVRDSGVIESLARLTQLASLDLAHSSSCDMRPLSALVSLTALRRCAPYRSAHTFFSLLEWPSSLPALRTVGTEMSRHVDYLTSDRETEQRAHMEMTFTTALRLRYPTLQSIS
jgi:hypothetical protein